MKRYFSISCLLIMMLAFPACEKVIEFDLSDAEEAIVIEATMSNSKAPITVLVSKTSPYFGAKTENPVTGAKVSIRIDKGKPNYLNETSPGVYTLAKSILPVNYWYVVEVEYDGVLYSARSFMNEVVSITEFGISYFDGFGIFDSGYKVTSYINDPGGKENYYRLKYYVNGKPVDDKGEISVFSDRLFDGKIVGLGQRSVVYNETDTLIVELQSIDKAAYDYFSTLENISGNIMEQSASPANPISNFSNGALGYFSAYSSDVKKIVIRDYLRKKPSGR